MVISTSLRANSNSDVPAGQFANGTREAGNEVEVISLRGKNIGYCIGCLACQKTGKCVVRDDVAEIMEKVLNADVVAWATPIYYYEMSGQMKTLIDRLNPMYSKEYKFRDLYFMTCAAEDDEDVPKRAISGLQGWIEYFNKASLNGYVFCGGVNAPGDIMGNDKLNLAYEMGKTI